MALAWHADSHSCTEIENQHLTALQVKLCGGEKTAQQQYQAGIRYVKVVGTPLYNFSCQLAVDLPVEAQMCKLSMWDPGPSAPQFGLNQQVSGVSDILPIPHCQGAVLEYILQDALVQAEACTQFQNGAD